MYVNVVIKFKCVFMGVVYLRGENFSLFLRMNCKNTTKDIHAS